MDRWFVSRDLTASIVVLPLLLVIALVGLAVTATPVVADTPTTLTLSAQKAVVDWHSTAILNGLLEESLIPPQPLDHQQVSVEYATTPSGVWSSADIVTNGDGQYYSGEYTYSWKAERTYYWRMDYPGVSGLYAAAMSAVLKVGVRPLVGTPTVPSGIASGQKFKVGGSLTPRFAAGSRTVRVRLFRYLRGKWRWYATYLAVNRNAGAYSSYSTRIALGKGTYRFVARTRSTSAYAAAKSGWGHPFRVR